MSNESAFQIVCTNCNCLSIKIEEPVRSSREAIVSCGDCGASRGTVGALRDLAIQGDPNSVSPADEHTAREKQAAPNISTQYAGLRRLRQQVKIAEWLANESNRPRAAIPVRKSNARDLAFRPTKISSLVS